MSSRLLACILEDAADDARLPVLALYTVMPDSRKAGIDAEEGKVADEGSEKSLKKQTGQGFLVVAVAFDELVFLVGHMAGHGGISTGEGR